jgi:tRNA (guanine-N7-)-methyltransferase
VNFPDPWPKLRHAKHRLIRAEFLEEIEKILIPGGKAYFTTDDRPYVDQMLEVVLGRLPWKSTIPSPHFKTDVPDFGGSYFCDLWKRKGRSIYHLQFEVIS